jgi:Tol biopolymer transport system component
MKRLLLLVVAAATLALGAESGNDLFQKAMVLERTDGKPAEAIKLYQRIVGRFASDRKLAAKALLQMGRCYERLGQADARRTYERLVKEYGDQNDAVAEARTRLAALIAAEGKPKFTKIRVPTKLPGGYLTAKALSPDGQQLAYLSDGAVWLLPVHGASHPEIAGPPRRITEPIPAWVQAFDIAWSRDGKWLALYVTERQSQGPEINTIYLVSSAGGEPRKAPVPKVWSYQGDTVADLSPDGEWLAFPSRKENETGGRNSIFIAPTAGGAARMVTPPISNQPEFSPDGKRIAYVGLLPDPQRDPKSPVGRQVWVTDVAGGTPVLIFELPPNGRLCSPVWSPDGKMLAFLATLENPGIWGNYGLLFIAPIAPDGRPAGPPAKIELPRKTMGRLAGWSKDNKIGLDFYAPGITAIYTVAASGGKAVQLTPKDASMPSWTPDGTRIYFAGVHHGTVESIEYVPAAGGQIVRIPVRGPHPIRPASPWSGISVSPDGRSILFQGYFYGAPVKVVPHIFTLPTEGGEVTELATGLRHELYYPCWSPDGRQIAFVSQEWPGAGLINSIYTMPAEGGSPRKLTSESDNVDEGQIAWSPDGKYLAYQSTDDKIRLLPLDSGPSQVLVEVTGRRWLSGLAWSPDGKELAYATKDRIWKVNLQSRKSEEVQTGLDAMHTQMTWSPDGKTIAFSASQGGDSELWLMEDFLPLTRARR